MKMKQVTQIADNRQMRIAFDPTPELTAAKHLVAQLFTDAVFNGDIRAISTIINRIDGGLPKDTEADNYRTLFGDCLNEILAMTDPDKIKVDPEDTVMMALSKSLYDLAAQDIYTKYEYDEDGYIINKKACRPSPDKKQERDQALRLVLERSGGIKTKKTLVAEEKTEMEIAPWIQKSLPSSDK